MQPNKSNLNKYERYEVWARIAAAKELVEISRLDASFKPGKPGSPFSICLIKLASITKGAGKGHIDNETLLERIIQNSSHFFMKEGEIRYQWNRALKIALPRYPKATRQGRK